MFQILSVGVDVLSEKHHFHNTVNQMSIFDTVKDDDIIKELGDLELSSMTPIDALNTLYRLQTKLKNRWQ